MVGVSAFASKVKNIASRNLTYKTGGTGKNGVCDWAEPAGKQGYGP